MSILSFCRDHLISLCSETLTMCDKMPLLLHAVQSMRMDVLELVFDQKSQRLAPDRILSCQYQYEGTNGKPKSASCISMACQSCLEGEPRLLNQMLSNPLVSSYLVHLSLAELGLRQLPLELFHEKLRSLSVRRNKLSQLPAVDKWQCEGLLQLNLAENLLTELPCGLFSLPKLKELNVADNEIATLEACIWSAPSLRVLNISNNCLKQFPCPEKQQASPKPSVARRNENLGDFYHPSVGTEAPEIVYSNRHSFVDIDLEREEDYRKSRAGHNLENLDVSSNQLTAIPSGLPCLSPLLLTLKLGKNSIKDLGHISDYPPGLKSLDLSCNGATKSIRPTKHASASTCFQLLLHQPSSAVPRRCTHGDHTYLPSLHYLNLSSNKLTTLTVEESSLSPPPISLATSAAQAVLAASPSHKEAKEKERDGVLFPKLNTLLVGKNCLKEVPDGLHKLEQLGSLDISNNESIERLPLSISHLRNLFSFKYAGISDPIVNELQNCQNVWEILYYLRARETKYESSPSHLHLPIFTLPSFILPHSHPLIFTLPHHSPTPSYSHLQPFSFTLLPSPSHLHPLTFTLPPSPSYLHPPTLPRATPNTSMRLFVIGHHLKGKTSLLNALRVIKDRSGSLVSPVLSLHKVGKTAGSENGSDAHTGMWQNLP